MSPFERFYCLHVRRADGCRVGSRELYAAYHRWAQANGIEQHTSFRQMRAAMRFRGHGHRKSSSMFYTGAALDHAPAGDAEVEAMRAEGQATRAARLDRIEAALRGLERELQALRAEDGL